jgi:hypothetical protein
MHAVGPFTIYDHAKAKGGENYAETRKVVATQALDRYKNDINGIAQLK